MSRQEDTKRTKEKPGFLDTLQRLFRGGEEPSEPTPQPGPSRLDALETDFEAAVGGLLEKAEELRRQRARPSAPRRATDRRERLAEIHRRIRGDVEQMHARLGTGITGPDLDDLADQLQELEQIAADGRDSPDLVPRARYAIVGRLCVEAGELAIDRLRELLQRAHIDWPNRGDHPPTASAEDIERSERRRRADLREAFLAQGFAEIARRAVGVVKAWGTDYPEPSSALWQECVLKGVGAGIRGQLAREFYEVLTQDPEAVVAGVDDAIGKEIGQLRSVLGAGVNSITEANQAVGIALQAVDLVAPEVAWRQLSARLPKTRGEWDD